MNFLKQALNITKMLSTEGEKRQKKLLKFSLELEFPPASFIQVLLINQELFDKGSIASLFVIVPNNVTSEKETI